MKQAALLQQQVLGEGLIYRLRAGAMGRGPVLAEWSVESGIEAVIASAEQYGREHGLSVVIRRAWLEVRIGPWPISMRVDTPDGPGEVCGYDSEWLRHLVRLDGETEARGYAPNQLRWAPEG